MLMKDLPVSFTVKQQRYRLRGQDADITQYLEKIAKYKHACGCASGALFASLAVLWFVADTAIRWENLNLLTHSLLGLLFIVLLGGVGKLVGVCFARLRLQRLYTFLIQKNYLELIEQ